MTALDDKDDEDDDEDVDATASEVIVELARFLAPFLRRYRGLLALLAFGLALEMLYDAAFPLAMRTLVDDALLGGDRGVLTTVLVLLVAGGVAACGAGIIGAYLYARLGAALLADVRERMFQHLQTLSMRYFGGARSGDILQRFSSDVGAIEGAVTTIVPWGVYPLAEVVAGTGLLFLLDRRLALIAMLVYPLNLLGPRLFASRSLSASHERRAAEASALSVVQESIAGQAVMKAFGLERVALSWFRRHGVRLRDRMQRMNFFAGMVEHAAEVVILALHVLILGIGANMAFSGTLTVGTLVTFEGVFLDLCYSLGYVTQYVPMLVQSVGGVRRVAELLEEEPDIADKPGAIPLPPVTRTIELSGVSFGYEDGAPVLKDLDLRIEHGSYVVIQGTSGSGKSTILSLLLRFFDPSAGAIRLDGQDIRDVTLASLRSRISVVFQDTVLFNTTLRENIRIGRLSATDEEVEAAARAAGIHDFIAGLPEGYDASAGERGGKLSGGQRQRIAIARAMLRQPSILLLDEATSALDRENEEAVNDTIARLAGRCTVIAVTHRPEKLRAADRFFVLEGGTLRECRRPEAAG